MKTTIIKKEGGRLALIDKDREKTIYRIEIASAPATKKGLEWLMQVETAHHLEHGANTPNTK